MNIGLVILALLVISYLAYRAYHDIKRDAPAAKALPRINLESNWPRSGTRLSGPSPLMTTWKGTFETDVYPFPEGQYRLSFTLYQSVQTEIYLVDAASGNRRTLLTTSETISVNFSIERDGDYYLGVKPSSREAMWSFMLFVPTVTPQQ